MKSMNFRSAAFWGRDLLFRGRVRAELRDVEFLNNRSQEATKRRLELLEQHLDYVTSKVPYYRNMPRKSSLTDFPIVNKEMIRSNQSKMISEGFDLSKLHVASTSGSTGTPFRVYQNVEKRRRADAESIYLGQLAGYEIGTPLWYLKLWTSRSSHSRIGTFARNIRPIDVSTFHEEDAEKLLNRIKAQHGSSSIVSYSSSLETIARMLRRKRPNVVGQGKIQAIVGQSEPLSQEARDILWRSLGTYPVARYGLEELGLLAQQEPKENSAYQMNLASHVVEVLRLDDDSRAAIGEVGRVVITDLFNKAQPMVRYDTDDLAIAASFEAGTGYADSFARLDGRSRERLYDVNDMPISPLISYNFWWKFPDLLQYQIVQRDRGHYILRLEVAEGFDQEAELVNELRRVAGKSAIIDVEYDDADYQRQSGKRQAVVSEYAPPASIED